MYFERIGMCDCEFVRYQFHDTRSIFQTHTALKIDQSPSSNNKNIYVHILVIRPVVALLFHKSLFRGAKLSELRSKLFRVKQPVC